ncbi:hypothetical protein [Clostridium drakei]|uniref:Uncharacterized protein n=1 Tax=Clostridium drakei TaxID=332101 RepID=A0A2U8DUJ4_9CLOT|nr:hypothetical protein [Clostridium drakei]AWI06065.1 hypothetical protein B9W14_16670 [Clostridium drakei]
MIINYIIISNISKEHCYRFLIADLLGKLICGVIYISFPTINVRPDITTCGIFMNMIELLYKIDAADNLLPSIHCLVSWYQYFSLAVIPNVYYKNFSKKIIKKFLEIKKLFL